jgi:UDP:flavonoid glycosyltransferase YjiC (YdhE family)
MQPTWQALIDGSKFCEPQLREIIARQRADVIVEDNVVTFPALQTAGKPFVRIVSCNPLEVRGTEIPPPYSGLPLDDRREWEAFREEYDRTHRPTWEDFDAWCRDQGTAPLPELEFEHTSRNLNLYVYPQVVDYTDRRPLDATWRRLDSSVRATDDAFELPESMANRPAGSGLIYLSLGSLGSADVELMERLVAVLADTPHRYIVSKGPQHADYELAANMWGAEFLPQTKIVPLVDLVITHGGNNTTTESFHFGKPMIVLPLFWDQYDNAQRVDETGFGVRLATYAFEPAELTGAIERLLADAELRGRMARTGVEIQARDGVAKAADAIESVGLAAR